MGQMCELLKEGIFYGIHGNEWCLMGQTIIGTRLMRYDSPPPPHIHTMGRTHDPMICCPVVYPMITITGKKNSSMEHHL